MGGAQQQHPKQNDYQNFSAGKRSEGNNSTKQQRHTVSERQTLANDPAAKQRYRSIPAVNSGRARANTEGPTAMLPLPCAMVNAAVGAKRKP